MRCGDRRGIICTMPKANRLVKYVQQEKSRHGKSVYYFRAGVGKRIRLPDDYGSEEFWEAYRLAFERGEYVGREPMPTASASQRGDARTAITRAIARAKHRAKANGLDFSITREWAIAEMERNDYRCAETNIPFLMKCDATSFMRPYVPSLDRIDPAKGYTQENVRVVVFAFNAMVSDWGDAVMHRIANGYRAAQIKKGTSTPAPSTLLPRTFNENNA